jgi:hypothetical protein
MYCARQWHWVYQSQKEKTKNNHTSVALKVTKERIENLC